MKYLKYFFISTALYLSGCSAAPVYKLTSVTTGGEYHNGKLIMSVNDGSAKSALNFDAQAGGYFSFFIVIENTSDSSFNIYPEDFYAEIVPEENGKDTLQPIRLYAYNPERQLETIDKNMAELNAQKNFNDGLNCLFLGAFVAVDIATIGEQKTEEEEIARQNVSDALLDKIDNDEINYQDKKYELEKDKDHWQYEVIRTNTLMPGEKTGGLFYVPILPKAKGFKVIIPIGEKEHIYNYRQERSK